MSVLTLVCAPGAFGADSIWDIEAVDANGVGTDPRIGADPTLPGSWVTVEGIALNASSEMLDGSIQWQVYLQGESPDAGGIAAWHGVWFNPSGWTWPPFPDVAAGDRIRIEALISDHNGKVNINSRHSSDPAMQFAVTVLQAGVGVPTARLIPDIAACTFFDQTRATGGEQYQAQWCQLSDVGIESGAWAAGQTLTITDASGQDLALLLSAMGDFGDYAVPVGTFGVRGIFDQEDPTPPAHGDYRLWVKHFSDFRFTLSLGTVNGLWGTVTVSPEPNDSNLPEFAPDDPNLRIYPGGTEVTLTAEPVEGRYFRHWELYDPNYPGDANYAELDSNCTTTLTMADSREVTAVFKCGSGLATPLVPMMLGVLGLSAAIRRRRG
ncbi:MAG: hypothetical protein JXQ73_24635 [Phycisphaerae bacterium]|nr:hypothetical protein [Phycisphaerae bacterium]